MEKITGIYYNKQEKSGSATGLYICTESGEVFRHHSTDCVMPFEMVNELPNYKTNEFTLKEGAVLKRAGCYDCVVVFVLENLVFVKFDSESYSVDVLLLEDVKKFWKVEEEPKFVKAVFSLPIDKPIIIEENPKGRFGYKEIK